MPETPKFYVTTPIYYVNARPHIGHAYTTIVADVVARRHRLLGDDTFFLTGTDEHGQKIERAAAAAGVAPQQFADEVSAAFEGLWRRMGITNNAFIRTTDPRHKQGVQKLFSDLYARGFIELRTYTGQYCVSEEMFVDGPPGTIGPDGKPTETVSEENFFFKLSEFQERLIGLIESNELEIQPESRRNEVLSFLRGGLKDLSISRSSFTWGIPVPEPAASEAKEKHVIYVWLDALANYLTAIGYGSEDPADLAHFERYWPADLHLVGKEIIRFHCVYWPAFLMAAELPLPKKIVAHGWLLFEESKMSKSRGNIVRTETILDAFGTLCPHVPPVPSHLLSSRSAAEGSASAAPADAPGTPSALLKGTASAVPPQASPGAGALAPEVPSLTPPTKEGEPSDARANGPAHTSLGRRPREGEPLDARAESPTHAAPAPPTKAQQDLFAADILRYFLLREIPFGQDGGFSFDALITRYNADLANGYGNLVSRVLAMIQNYFAGKIPQENLIYSEATARWAHEIREVEDADKANFQFALRHAFNLISSTDEYITSQAPWKLASDPDNNPKLAEILYCATEWLRLITALLYPVMPFATASVWRQLGLGDIEKTAKRGELKELKWGDLRHGTKLGPRATLFPSIKKEDIPRFIQMMTDIESPPPVSQDPTNPAAPPRTSSFSEPNPGAHVGASSAVGPERFKTPPHGESPASGLFATASAASSAPDTRQISIDDFVKVDLRVARILVAERIPKADKLLRLEVDLGPSFSPPTRQILAGIAEHYAPETLIGRKVVIVANLAPRKMRGLESQGMLVAASLGEQGRPVLAGFLEDIEVGARLK